MNIEPFRTNPFALAKIIEPPDELVGFIKFLSELFPDPTKGLRMQGDLLRIAGSNWLNPYQIVEIQVGGGYKDEWHVTVYHVNENGDHKFVHTPSVASRQLAENAADLIAFHRKLAIETLDRRPWPA